MICDIKLVILGESTTGKTTLAYRMARNSFNENMESTIGASYMTLRYENIKYEIWDTAGQERYLSLVKLYYRNANLILLVFDMSKPNTMDRFTYYLDKITEDLSHEYRILVIGNKCDLINHEDIKKLDFDVKKKLDKYGNLKNRMDFMYISTKTGFNFEKLVDKIKELGLVISQNKSNQLPIQKNVIQLTSEPTYEQNPLKIGKQYCYC